MLDLGAGGAVAGGGLDELDVGVLAEAEGGEALVGVEENGTPIGTVARDDVVRLLLGGEA